MTKHLFVALSLSLAACGGAISSVEMKGADTEVAQLAGDWEGSYTGIESGRSGPVSFSLQLGRHTADGTVLLGGATPLKIEFVAVEDGTISGKMDPYQDPSCTCEVQTEFVGTVFGDAITGSYTTTVVGADKQMHGEWSVARKPGA